MNPKDRAGAKKPNLSVLPFAPLYEVVAALYEGRRKYGPWNWRAEKVSETIYADAAIRHLMQFIAGEDIDPDSGVHHITKAIAGLLVVRDAQIHGCSLDDRLVDQNLNIDAVIEKLAGINERYPEPAKSELPPRDQGITGGETFTDEEAEKVAEYLFGGQSPLLSELADQHFSGVGHNDFVLDPKDVGRTIVNRAGKTAILEENEGSEEFCFQYRDGGIIRAVDCYGRYAQGGQTDFDVVGIKPVKYSDTACGGGSYEINKADVGKKVLLRNGEITEIEAFNEHYTWKVKYRVKLVDRDNAALSATVHGQYSPSADGTYRNGCDEEWDIVRVFHS